MQSTQKNIKNNNLLININKLNVFFNTPEGLSHVVKDVNFNVKKGTCLGVVGESGSGKTQTFFSITGLLAKNGYAEGEANFKDYNLSKFSPYFRCIRQTYLILNWTYFIWNN